MKHLGLRTAISLSAAIIIGARLIWPQLNIDATTLGLLALLLLPWLSPLIKSAELPGGWKIEFKDVERAAAKITARAAETTRTGAAWPVHEFTAVTRVPDRDSDALPHDANLALVSVRIEIEKRLRALARRKSMSSTAPLTQLIAALRNSGVLTSDEASGLGDIVAAGNEAAHGASVDPDVLRWARTFGLDILDILDAKMLIKKIDDFVAAADEHPEQVEER